MDTNSEGVVDERDGREEGGRGVAIVWDWGMQYGVAFGPEAVFESEVYEGC